MNPDEVIRALRTAPSPKIPLRELQQQKCTSCGNTDLSLSRYPGFVSLFFSGLMLMHCGECGLSWVPIPDLDLESYYKHHYASEFRKERIHRGAFYSPDNPALTQKKHAVRDRAYNHIEILKRYGPIGAILDIGCGEGFLLQRIEAAEKFAHELDENVRDILLDEIGATVVQQLDVESRYDTVVASHVLEHFTYLDIRDKLKTIFKSMRSGGIFLMEVPGGAYQIERFTRGQRPVSQRLEPHTLFFSSYSLVRLLVDTGFTILEARSCLWTERHARQRQAEIVCGRTKTDGPLIIVARAP